MGKRLGIVFAGPFFNFLFAVVALAVIFMAGMPTLLPEVGEVKPDYPAYQAGLQKGDRILEVNGAPVKRWEDLAQIIHESARSVPCLQRWSGRAEDFPVSVTPQVTTQKNIFGDEVRVGLIGISPSGNFFIERFDPFTATYRAVVQSWRITELTAISIVKIIEGKSFSQNHRRPDPDRPTGRAAGQGRGPQPGLLHGRDQHQPGYPERAAHPGSGRLAHPDVHHRRGHGKPVSLKIRERAQQIGVFIIISHHASGLL